jgi:hypothetical protein
VGVDIHEAGANDLAAGVDLAQSDGLPQVADGGDALAADSHVGDERLCARAVSHQAAANEQVECCRHENR